MLARAAARYVGDHEGPCVAMLRARAGEGRAAAAQKTKELEQLAGMGMGMKSYLAQARGDIERRERPSPRFPRFPPSKRSCAVRAHQSSHRYA